MEGQTLNAITLALTKAGLQAGTGSSYTTSAAVAFAIKGKFGTALSAQTNAATPTTDGNTGAAFNVVAKNKGCAFVFALNSGGTLSVYQGDIVDLDDAGDFVNAPPFPGLPDTVCPFGYLIIKNGSTGSDWTFGSSNWTATGITDTFVDICTMPDRPQES